MIDKLTFMKINGDVLLERAEQLHASDPKKSQFYAGVASGYYKTCEDQEGLEKCRKYLGNSDIEKKYFSALGVANERFPLEPMLAMYDPDMTEDDLRNMARTLVSCFDSLADQILGRAS